MTTLKYKIFETILRLTGAGKTIGKGLAKGNIPSVGVPSGVQKRWAQSEFQGRDIFTCRPVGKSNGRVYVHQHGGAYVVGLIEFHFTMFTKLADMSGVTIILPDYPMPPDMGAPGIIDWATAHYETVIAKYGAETVMLGGDSAGGNLALAMSQKTSVNGPLVLLSPWVNLDIADIPDDNDSEEILLDPVAMKAAAARYAKELGAKSPLISPMFAHPKDLPEVVIFTGEKDSLFDDIMTFSERMNETGKLRKLATYGEFGHYWMFYPTRDRDSTLIELADILRG
jgi:acetyl esterase/lipase